MAEKKIRPLGSNERRRHPRYEHETAIWLEVSEDQPLWRTKTADVSAGGLLIEIRRPLPVGLEFKIHLELPMFVDLISTICRVRRCTEKNGVYQVGVEFSKTDGITEKQLVEFLKAYFDG